MAIKTIAIVGCGAAGTTFIRSFIEECIENKITPHIMVFERASELGPGLAYQHDIDQLLINRPIQHMSANPDNNNEFFSWFKQKRLFSDEEMDTKSEPIYTSRKNFGLYLNELFEKTIIKASLHHISIRVIYENVVHIRGVHTFLIETQSNKIFLANAIILCTGHNQPKDIYRLKNTPKFINSPYPLYNTLSHINPSEQVGIIGNSLTAIDITIALKKTGFRGTIKMFSRKYIIPRVRGLIGKHIPRFLTVETINKMLMAKSKLSLRDILRLFRKEIHPYNLSWKLLFKEDDKNKTFSEILHAEILSAQQKIPWQAIIPSTNIVSEFLWHILNDRDKELFLTYFQRSWLNQRSSIPPLNARLLLNLIEEDRLSFSPGLKTITYEKNTGKYLVFNDGVDPVECDWIINATGPAKYIQFEDTLVYGMMKQGIAKAHKYGGLEVDFDTSALVNNEGYANPYIRLIGHNTAGVYQYTSSLELISKQAKKVAKNFAAFLKEVSHDKNPKSIITHSDRISHLTQTIG